MNTRTVVFAVVALFVAVGTAVLIQNWMSAQRALMLAQIPKKEEAPKGSRIIVAKKDLPIGTLLKPEDMEWQAWPPGKLSQAYMVEGKKEISAVAGAVVRHPISEGEPMTAGQVVKPGERGYLAAVLSPGMRAMTVPINATSGIAGFVFPGDRVDIILGHKYSAGEGRDKKTVKASETVLENVRVLAVDQSLANPTGKASIRKTATLEVTPRQAELITVARALGGLSLVLRGLRKEDGDLDTIPSDDSVPVAGSRGRTLTRDFDVSRAIGSSDEGDSHVINVIHGQRSDVRKFQGKGK